MSCEEGEGASQKRGKLDKWCLLRTWLWQVYGCMCHNSWPCSAMLRLCKGHGQVVVHHIPCKLAADAF